LRLHELTLPARGLASAVQLGSSSDGRLVASWLEPENAGHALRVAECTAAGWGPAQTVVSGRDIVVNAFDVPSVVPGPESSLWAAWLWRSPQDAAASEVRLARGRAGAPWSRAITPHRERSVAERGFVSLLPTRDGALEAFWLDAGPRPGAEAPATTALRHVRVQPDGAITHAAVLDQRVCDCCQTAGRRLHDGLLLAYRDRSPDEVRDIALLRRPEGAPWEATRVAHADGWRLAGCPVNGPALAVHGTHVALAWYSGAQEPAVRVLLSADDGRTFGAAVRVDLGHTLGRVDVAWARADLALVSWVEAESEGLALHVRPVALDGRLGASQRVAATLDARQVGVPRLERGQAQVVLAWRDSRHTPALRSAAIEVSGAAAP
jgi:hypothetical protein